MKFLLPALVAVSSVNAFSSVHGPMPRIVSVPFKSNNNGVTSAREKTSLYISDGSDRSERQSLDISTTTYASLIKAPKDAYIAFAEKGKSNAQMHWLKTLHQSILGGCYVGFGGLLALSVAGNMAGTYFANPGLVKFTFAALFPVNLLLIVMTGGQLFTGNSATCAAAKAEGMISWGEMWQNLAVALTGNIIGCALFALTANYVGLLSGGTAALAKSTAIAKCGGAFMPTLVKGILCNWMVSLAVFMAGASNDLAGKLVGCWFPISTFVGIGLEHSIANLFILPCALLLGAPVTLGATITKNLIPVILGNFIAGSIVVAGSYSYQFGQLGKNSREKFREYLKDRQAKKAGLVNGVVNGVSGETVAAVKKINEASAETKQFSKVFE